MCQPPSELVANEFVGLSCFDAADYLTDEETIAAYLECVASEGNASALGEAMNTVA
ncbi:hypothetical protein [Pelomonas cellulosilytica]|uniref:hypothetical protein n=1 Tax=Pelomonas cellulosilytica TaxID=2906762 RepID=UPI003B02B638